MMVFAEEHMADSSSVLTADRSLFRENFDRKPFCLTHSLADHRLLEVSRLLQLAEFLRRDPHNTAYDAGEIHVEQRWNQRPQNPYTLREALERIDCTGAWVILKHCERDPEYKALMNAVLLDVERLSGTNLRRAIKKAEAQIMVTSPGRITPYHFDNECNVLLQIKGEKDLFVFDQTDRSVLTDIELERFWVGDWNAGEYKARCQDRAHAFRLAPGKAVHIPVNAPHWVKNNGNVSVSLSVNFEWKDESLFNVYRANYFLRKMGVQPSPPGESRLRDGTKHVLMAAGFVPARNMARNTLRFLRRLRHTTIFFLYCYLLFSVHPSISALTRVPRTGAFPNLPIIKGLPEGGGSSTQCGRIWLGRKREIRVGGKNVRREKTEVLSTRKDWGV